MKSTFLKGRNLKVLQTFLYQLLLKTLH
ncbi:hypothetical protein Goklo_026955 [Gossypium klotzschianum]|uniref:Uncharacterized protein n=1 Tax=Gossypium klotzschianum TaxID=34286 RepID=A0A7J8TWS2_9ROSI|nr:hypothetical protein [Gossypium klotzschianum]